MGAIRSPVKHGRGQALETAQSPRPAPTPFMQTPFMQTPFMQTPFVPTPFMPTSFMQTTPGRRAG